MHRCSLESLAEIAPQGAKCEFSKLQSQSGALFWVTSQCFLALGLPWLYLAAGPGNRLGSFDWNCSRAGPRVAFMRSTGPGTNSGDLDIPGLYRFSCDCSEISTKPKAGNIWLADPNTSDKGNERIRKK